MLQAYLHYNSAIKRGIDIYKPRLKGCTHRATEALRWLSMRTYQCIEVFVDLWARFFLATECINRNGYRQKVRAILGFRLISNMLNISFAMGMFSY